MSEESKYDVRLVEKRIRKGTITPEEYQKQLDGLPDDAAECEPSKVQFSSPFADAHYRHN